jgi:tRNA modification GTPase
MSDTICALATAIGGAIGIIRVSGDRAISISDKCFRAKSGKPLACAKANTVHYGEFIDADGTNVIDDVLVSVYRAPHSYTGEESVEISCHGSRYILRQVLQTLIDNGCRQARPGEYTQRAYLNGKMDLSQAEAVADLVAATNKATHRMALSQLKGNFSNELTALRDQLLHITSLLELELDFSDQDVNFADRAQLKALAEKIDQRIMSLAHTFETGNALKQGIPVAIIGKTNVGKSTLLNALLHDDKAIVSNIHGTTRDVIEDTTDIHGITFRFIDTAGIRHTSDEIEQMGIDRTFKKLDEAAIVLWLIDAMPTESELNDIIGRCHNKKLIIICNKIDKSAFSIHLTNDNAGIHQLAISAKYGTNLDQLEATIYECADIAEINENDVIITSTRHYEALTHAHESISRVISGLNAELSGDLISEDLRICLEQLAEITGGTITSNEVLESIFSHFCIGK